MRTLLALLLLSLPMGAHAQLVKCIGKDGKVEYARDCPPGTTEQKTGIRSNAAAPSSSAPAPQKSLAERDAAFKKRMIERQEADQKAEKLAAEANQKREACDNAQAYLKAIESGQRLSRTDPKTGERVFMEDAERQAEAARAQGSVSQNCK